MAMSIDDVLTSSYNIGHIIKRPPILNVNGHECSVAGRWLTYRVFVFAFNPWMGRCRWETQFSTS